MFTRVLRYLPYALPLALLAMLLVSSVPAFTDNSLSPAPQPPVTERYNFETAYADFTLTNGTTVSHMELYVVRVIGTPPTKVSLSCIVRTCSDVNCSYNQGQVAIPSQDVRFGSHHQVSLHTDTTGLDLPPECKGLLAVEWAASDQTTVHRRYSYMEDYGYVVARFQGDDDYVMTQVVGTVNGGPLITSVGEVGKAKYHSMSFEPK